MTLFLAASVQKPTRDIDVVTTTDLYGNQRHLVKEELRCRLWQNCLQDQDPVVGDSHWWECTFDETNKKSFVKRLGGHTSRPVIVEGVESTNKFLEVNGADSAHSVLVMTKANIHDDKVVVQYEDVIGVEEYDPDNKAGGSLRGDAKPPKMGRRFLAPMSGDLNTLVVRVNANNASPGATAQAISDDVFNDEYCLKSQFGRCSYNKLTIQEYIPGSNGVPTSAPGVLDIYIDHNVTTDASSRGQAQQKANDELVSLFGTSPNNVVDLVLFCMPPGMGNWLAYAYIGRWDSYYNDYWCQKSSSQMHEVGHSIGLHHSGEYEGSESAQEYGDQSDLMGFSYNEDDTDMCFNPAKNWQLKWYLDKQIEVNANDGLSTEATTYILNGVVDYDDTSLGANIVIKVGDFYIGYNKATEFNSGVKEGANTVIVNEKLGSATSSTKSKLAAKLTPGAFVNIDITSVLQVQVKFVELQNNKDAVVELRILGQAPECQGEYDASIDIELITDRYPTEISWSLTDANGVVLASRDEDFYRNGDTLYTETVDGLCRGLEYYFVIQDGYGDGICCQWGEGSYVGKYGDVTLFSGGQYQNEETQAFVIPFDAPTTDVPTSTPTKAPTNVPTAVPTPAPTKAPTSAPTVSPVAPTDAPTKAPTAAPTPAPTVSPTPLASGSPTVTASDSPTVAPTDAPTKAPTEAPTPLPSASPTVTASDSPTVAPTDAPTKAPTEAPTKAPTVSPTPLASDSPTVSPTDAPTKAPTAAPTPAPPTDAPTKAPTRTPTTAPTKAPTVSPTFGPTNAPVDATCVDDLSWIYRDNPAKDCAWVADGSDRKTRIKCQRRANSDKSDDRKVSEYCKLTCFNAGLSRSC